MEMKETPFNLLVEVCPPEGEVVSAERKQAKR